MTRFRLAHPRKRRTRQHVIADLSVNHVERQALLCGFSVERTVHDYGTDLVVNTYDSRGEIENGLIFFQVKATDKLRLLAARQAIALRLASADIRLWLGEPLPVILVMYDAVAEKAFWLHVQAYFGDLPGFEIRDLPNTLTVHLPQSQVLDLAAMRHVAARKNAIWDQMSGRASHVC